MKLKTLFSIFAAGSFALSSVALAAGSKTYQVTGHLDSFMSGGASGLEAEAGEILKGKLGGFFGGKT